MMGGLAIFALAPSGCYLMYPSYWRSNLLGGSGDPPAYRSVAPQHYKSLGPYWLY